MKEAQLMYRAPVYIGSEIYRQSSFGHNHPLSYARQESVLDMCKILGWIQPDMFLTSPKADTETLGRFHAKEYVQALGMADKNHKASVADRKTYNFGTMENPLFKGLYQRAATYHIFGGFIYVQGSGQSLHRQTTKQQPPKEARTRDGGCPHFT